MLLPMTRRVTVKKRNHRTPRPTEFADAVFRLTSEGLLRLSGKIDFVFFAVRSVPGARPAFVGLRRPHV